VHIRATQSLRTAEHEDYADLQTADLAALCRRIALIATHLPTSHIMVLIRDGSRSNPKKKWNLLCCESNFEVMSKINQIPPSLATLHDEYR
jgi:hypothetical protein